MKKIIVLLMAAICFVSCKSLQHTVEVPVYIHDTTYKVKELHDSTYIDRWHTIVEKGDTVLMRDSVAVIKYRFITDTAYKYVEKPVEVVVRQIEEVAKPLSWWQRTLMYMGVAALALLVLWVVWKVALRR